jgi:hypothetical protein
MENLSRVPKQYVKEIYDLKGSTLDRITLKNNELIPGTVV